MAEAMTSETELGSKVPDYKDPKMPTESHQDVPGTLAPETSLGSALGTMYIQGSSATKTPVISGPLPDPAVARQAEPCALCPYGGRCVGARGPEDADWAILGEAPGADELRTLRPFTGPSGKLLEGTIANAGLPSSLTAFVVNAMQCRPTDTPPKSEAIDSCRNRVLSEVFGYPRKLVIALGNSAMRSLTDAHGFKITQGRGRVVFVQGVPVVPTFHPAAILRQHQMYPLMLADFQYAAQIYNTGGIKQFQPPDFSIVTRATLNRAVTALNRQPWLSADVETSTLSPRTGYIISLAIGWAPDKVLIFPRHLLDTPEVKGLLESGPPIVWHNGKYDASFFWARGISAQVSEDTMLQHYLLNEQKNTHGLKQLASDYLGAPNYQAALKPYLKRKADSYTKVPRQVLYKYQAIDASVTHQIHSIQRPKIAADRGLEYAYTKILIPASPFLMRVEANGIPIGQQELAETRELVVSDIEYDTTTMRELIKSVWDAELYAAQTGHSVVPFDFNPGSHDQVRWILYRRFGLRPKRGYQANTREGTLLNLQGPTHPFVTALLDYREKAKQLSTYIDGIAKRLDVDGRVHSSYLIHGTTTGRLSSQDPNMQNWPRQGPMKNIVVAPPGRILGEYDMSQSELRCLAHLSRDEFLTQVYRDGRDLHNEMAAAIYGPNYTSEERVMVKFLNFGIVYGRGPQSVAAQYGISVDEARRLINDWLRRAPQAAAYMRKCRNAVRTTRVLTTEFGRKRRFPVVTDLNRVDLENEAVNFPISSLSSDLVLRAYMKAEPRLAREWDTKIINLVHDSGIVEMPDDPQVVQEVSSYVISVMEEIPRLTLRNCQVPFKADGKVGHSWGKMVSLEKFFASHQAPLTLAAAL